MRFGLCRNLLPVYDREWKNGNSRWDLLDPLRMAWALRPEGLNWPEVQGRVSFKLEDLTQANGIGHEQAHDALADVYATLALAQKLKAAQPKLYAYLFNHRRKDALRQIVNPYQAQAFVHTSGMLGHERHYTSVFYPLMPHPNNSNAIICVDLNQDFSIWPELTTEDFHHALFTPGDQRNENHPYVGIKGVHLNRAPAVAPLSVLLPETQARLGLDLEEILMNQEWMAAYKPQLIAKLKPLYNQAFAEETQQRVDEMLYAGFINPQDQHMLIQLQTQPTETWDTQHPPFSDERLIELYFLAKGRNSPQALTDQEKAQWLIHCRQAISDPKMPTNLHNWQEKLHKADLNPMQQQTYRSYVEQLIEKFIK